MSFASRQTDRHRPTDRPPTPPLHPPLFRCFPVIFAQCTAGRRGFVLKLSTRRTIGRRLAYPNKENSPSSHHPPLPAPRRAALLSAVAADLFATLFLPPSLSSRHSATDSPDNSTLLPPLIPPPPPSRLSIPISVAISLLFPFSLAEKSLFLSLCFSLVRDGYFRGRGEREQVEFFNKIGTNRWSF